MRIINKNNSGRPDIIGDISPYKAGDVGKARLHDIVYSNVKIKEVIGSYTDEYLDHYLVVDLPNKKDVWVMIAEFEKE